MKINIEKAKREFDCISVEFRQMSLIEKWHLENYDNLYYPENLIFEKGIVEYKGCLKRKDGTLADIIQMFHKKNNDTIETVLILGDDVYSVHHIKRNDGFLCTIYFPDGIKESIGFDEEEQRKLCEKYARGFVQLLSYASDRSKERIKVESRPIVTTKGATASVRKKRVITITNKIYDYEKREGTKEYNRVIESWSVRGHWRQYKSGKRSWVTPYVKGHGEKESKEYTLG